MAKINPKILFKKDTFIYGKDLNIEGTISLPEIDISTIHSISIEHAIWYGVSEDDTNKLEGFSHSTKRIISTKDISLISLDFSLPLTIPNISKNDGASFDGEYSLIQNVLTITVKEKAFFSLKDSEKTIVPIQWEVFQDKKINLSEIKEAISDAEDYDEIPKEKTSPLMLDTSIILPWDLFDTVSKDYYTSILEKFPLAKLGNIFYTNTISKLLTKMSYWVFFGGLLFLIYSGKITEPWVENTKKYIFLGVLICIVFILIQIIPKWYLRKKVSIDDYIPQIGDESMIEEKLKSNTISLGDLFLPFSEKNQSPLIGISGTLEISISLGHEYSYTEGKHTRTHTQPLLSGNIYSSSFSSIGNAISNTKIELPHWVLETFQIKESEKIGFKKDLNINIIYSTLPDKTYNIELN